MFAILLGTYTNFAMHVGALIYGLVPLILGGFLFLRHLRTNIYALRFLVYLVGICGVINAGSAGFPTNVVELIQSTTLLGASVASGLGLFLELRRWPRRWFSRMMALATISIIVLGYLETYTRFASVSDLARETLYAAEGQFLYSSDERDLFLHGTVRPKIFTQEPSHPAKFLAIALSAWFLVSVRRQKLMIAVAGFIIALHMLRSPSVLTGMILTFYFFACGADGELTPKTTAIRLGVFVLCAVGILTLPQWAAIVPVERAREISEGLDASAIIRLLGPMQIASEIVQDHPLFGVGIGGKDYAWDILLGVYSSFPGVKLERFYLMSDAGWGNAFFQFIAYTGLFGSIAVLWWLARLSKRMIVNDWASIIFAFFIVFNLDGSFNTVRPWIYLFLLAAAYHVRVRDDRARSAQPAVVQFPRQIGTRHLPRAAHA